jgi:hypothetical protein
VSVGKYVGRTINAEAPSQGLWCRVHLDTRATIYAEKARLAHLVELFGERLPEVVVRFETTWLKRQVKGHEVLRLPDGWSMTVPFHPDMARTMDQPSDQERLALVAIVERFPERPVRNGIEESMQRVRRIAIGMLGSTVEAPYHPDPVDAEELSRFLFTASFARVSNPENED